MRPLSLLVLATLLTLPTIALAQDSPKNPSRGTIDRLIALEEKVSALEFCMSQAKSDIADLQTSVGDLQTSVTGLRTDLDAVVDGVGDFGKRLAQAELDIRDLDLGLADVDRRLTDLDPILNHISLDDDGSAGLPGPHLIFSGVNVCIQDGTGQSDTLPWNGLGNLVLGYNEEPSGLLPGERDSIHSIILGTGHRYTANGAIISGRQHTVTGGGSVAIGGTTHVVSAGGAAVGGTANAVLVAGAAAVGGHSNSAEQQNSVVVGGRFNRTLGFDASVTGGSGNRAEGNSSSVSGGRNRQVLGDWDWGAGTLFEDE